MPRRRGSRADRATTGGRARPGRWALVALVGAVLAFASLPPAPVGPTPSSAGPSPRTVPDLGGAGSAVALRRGSAPSTNVVVTLSANRLKIDLGGNLTFTGKLAGNRTLNVSWVGLPKGCPRPASPTKLVLFCDPNQTGTFRVYLNITTAGYRGGANVSIAIFAVPTVNITATPASGVAPLSVTFFANLTGGAPPVAISWISSDGSIASGALFNHTFEAPGTYFIDLWVNDSTLAFDPAGQYVTVFEFNVSAAPPVKGLFGLPDHDGLYLLAVGVGVLILLAVYEALTRRRPTRLPPAEAWMKPPESRPTLDDSEPAPPRGPPSS